MKRPKIADKKPIAANLKSGEEQREGQFDVWQTDLSNPKFSEFAKSCGMIGLRVENSSEIGVNMNQLFQAEGPALLEIVTDPDKM
jgi:pyruvate oxidase